MLFGTVGSDATIFPCVLMPHHCERFDDLRGICLARLLWKRNIAAVIVAQYLQCCGYRFMYEVLSLVKCLHCTAKFTAVVGDIILTKFKLCSEPHFVQMATA